MPSSNSGGAASVDLPDAATDHWTLSGRWATRPETELHCAGRLIQFLEGIRSLHPSLARWLYSTKPIRLDAAAIASHMRRDEQFPEHGYKLTLWNGAPDRPTQATIMVNCGVTAPYVQSFVSLELPRPVGAPELYAVDTMRMFVETAVSTWDMAWCSVRPHGLWKASDPGDSHAVFASWLAYLDDSLIVRLGDLPAGVGTLDSGNGRLFVMAPTPAELTLDVVQSVARAVELDPEWQLS